MNLKRVEMSKGCINAEIHSSYFYLYASSKAYYIGTCNRTINICVVNLPGTTSMVPVNKVEYNGATVSIEATKPEAPDCEEQPRRQPTRKFYSSPLRRSILEEGTSILNKLDSSCRYT